MVLANMMQTKFEHLIHMKAKSERPIYRRQSRNYDAENVMQTKFERLIHDDKEKFEYLNPRK